MPKPSSQPAQTGARANTPSPRDDEDRLSRRAARGDREAAGRLAELTYGRTFAGLVQLSGDPELAADLTQETYRRAWSALASFQGKARFSTWLYRIAYTTFLNHVRKPRRLAPLDETQVDNIVDPSPSADDNVLRARRAARLRRAVLGLPDELRFAVTARYWGEVPVREIARQEGLSAVGIRKRLLRAYDRLAEDLGTDLERLNNRAGAEAAGPAGPASPGGPSGHENPGKESR